MSSSDDIIPHTTRHKFSSSCSEFHNNEVKCNSNGTSDQQCIFTQRGKYTAAKCSPISAMRKRIKSSINKGESLSTKDITDIQLVTHLDF